MVAINYFLVLTKQIKAMLQKLQHATQNLNNVINRNTKQIVLVEMFSKVLIGKGLRVFYF
ncbi:hypothetical protein FACS189432_01670 [Bacteroidia bacterium]|nr:hypothetical protein FACS189426_01430 [Bacteroidia bacterium]GHT26706.1 hypothetical protein FACS189432_01670 [Bacteroidia bacterium]